VPRERRGQHARQMLESALPGYLLLHTEPWADAALPQALATLAAARDLVAVTPYAGEELRRVATVLLPAGSFAETSGTYVNLEGRWQSYAAAARPLGAARPAWKILRVLGTLLGLSGFDYQSCEQVCQELAARVKPAASGAAAPDAQSAGARTPVQAPAAQASSRTASAAPAQAVGPVLDLPMYAIDPIVRRADALQCTREGRAPAQRYGSGS